MKVKVTVLCENTVACPGKAVLAEHGWAAFIETEFGNILFDTGQGMTIINNARILKKDLSSLIAIALSHHHYDHTGGLLDVLETTGEITVYAHPELFKDSYNIKNGNIRYSGMPFKRELIERKGAKFDFSVNFREIVPGVYLTGEIPRVTPFEKGEENMVINSADGMIQDPLSDDQAIIIETSKGLFVVLGCAHSGIINTLEYAIKMTGQEKIHTVIGGTHLGMVSDEQREESIKALKKYNIVRLGVSHCTGAKASYSLARDFPNSFYFCNVGMVQEGE